jgi:hypothetical protein
MAQCLGSSAADAQQIKSLVSAGGSEMISGDVRLAGNLGDIVSGVSRSGAIEVQHGFWATPEAHLVAVDGAKVVPPFCLRPCWPNPAQGHTIIEFALPTAGHAILQVYDVSGRMIRELANGLLPVGVSRRTWDLRTNAGEVVASGVYIYKLECASFSVAGKLCVVH